MSTKLGDRMPSLARLLITAALVAGCTAVGPSPVAPTPQIVYVTAPPQPSVVQPTPIVIYVTPAPTASPTNRAISGTITLALNAYEWGVQMVSQKPVYYCHSISGYTDIEPGTVVVVRDQVGTVIATGPLSEGAYAPETNCVFPFTVMNVPDAPFYSIEVGHRGAVNFSRADLEANGWTVALTLGG